MSQISQHIHINGIVQGVGFRPFIYNLAQSLNLNGWVRNSASGVDIEVTGENQTIEKFLQKIKHSAPPLAEIDLIEARLIPHKTFDEFNIITSNDKSSDFIPISPDVAICKQCQKELFDPSDRRYQYPFINCTNCGPRITIVQDIPYDRPKTTMASFEMCQDCRREYENPSDRRFHAQPIACPVCGPQIWLEISPGEIYAEKEQALQGSRDLLKDGKILAIKGLGGYHLACDATNGDAVNRLRELKKRPAKPFGLMAFDLEIIQKYVHTSSSAEKLLMSPQAPIVLMPQKAHTGLSKAVAPHQTHLGFMLPYTPLHLLLLAPEDDYPDVWVMTSGNLSEEPVLTDNQLARQKLAGIADGFLMHDRPIHMRMDDSVFSLVREHPYPIRRARGYAPNPIRLSQPLPQILAVGPQMKNTFCLTRDNYAFVSHYIGEMDNWETYQDYQKSINQYESLFRIDPQAIAHDLHPDYASTQYTLKRAAEDNIPRYPIQHHHAHLAACMIENNLPAVKMVAGIIFDGTGYGEDGTIWGGEILLGNCLEFSREYHLKPVLLPGGDVSIIKPARMALSTLWAYNLPWDNDLPSVQALTELEKTVLKTQLERKTNSLLTSSMGRLFDAVSALIGIRQEITFEAQAAIEMEALADKDILGYYPWQMDKNLIDVKTTLEAILSDLSNGVLVSIIAARFHNTIAQITLETAKSIYQKHEIDQIILSGGVWQNNLLLNRTMTLLEKNGLHPLIHQKLPPNDGCVAFGQAMIAAYRYMKDKE